MKTFIAVSLLIAVASALDIAAREPQPASLFTGINEEAKAAILASRSGYSGLKLARQFNCDRACILANTAYCDSEACEEGVDANWCVMAVMYT